MSNAPSNGYTPPDDTDYLSLPFTPHQRESQENGALGDFFSNDFPDFGDSCAGIQAVSPLRAHPPQVTLPRQVNSLSRRRLVNRQRQCRGSTSKPGTTSRRPRRTTTHFHSPTQSNSNPAITLPIAPQLSLGPDPTDALFTASFPAGSSSAPQILPPTASFNAPQQPNIHPAVAPPSTFDRPDGSSALFSHASVPLPCPAGSSRAVFDNGAQASHPSIQNFSIPTTSGLAPAPTSSSSLTWVEPVVAPVVPGWSTGIHNPIVNPWSADMTPSPYRAEAAAASATARVAPASTRAEPRQPPVSRCRAASVRNHSFASIRPSSGSGRIL
ncbi:hypothetical protein BJV74DRAFT_949803 [Russula compacta]|nr:hypothetical protein BJV74DRAFT_949803 [Russula compacta]